VADDDPDSRRAVADALAADGHYVAALADGRRLAEVSRHLRPDLFIVAAAGLPGLDGARAAAAVNRDRDVPVILLVGLDDAETRRRSVADRVMACLFKPVRPPGLQAALAVAMARFRQFLLVRQEAEALKQALADCGQIEPAAVPDPSPPAADAP
jgi:response regulator NasT